MATWEEWVLGPVVVLLAVLVVYAVILMVRRRIITRDGGTFELSYRVRGARPGRGWLLGIGRYSGENLEWFRIFSVSPTAKRVWQRRSLAYVSSRAPEGVEQMALYPDHVIVVCQFGTEYVELAMSPQSLIGFQAWLESRHPGTDWSR